MNILLVFGLGLFIRSLAKTEAEIQANQRRELTQAQALKDKVNQILEAIQASTRGETVEIKVSGQDPIGQLGEGFTHFLLEKSEQEKQIHAAHTRESQQAKDLRTKVDSVNSH